MIVHSRTLKIFIAAGLSLTVIFLSYYFHLSGEDRVFPHMYWFPVILIIIWWGFKGWLFSILLILTLPITHLVSNIETNVTYCGLRAFSLVVLSFVFALIVQRQKKAQHLQRESEEKYSGFFRTSNDCFFMVSNEGKIAEINGACLDLFGYEHADDLLDMKLADLCKDKQVYSEHFQLVRQQGFSRGFALDFRKKDNTVLNALVTTVQKMDEHGNVSGYQGTIRDISRQRQAEESREEVIQDLQKALEKIDTLKGMLPICSNCKKIRDDEGYWHEVEEYVHSHSEAEFTHGICPECVKRLYPEFSD